MKNKTDYIKEVEDKVDSIIFRVTQMCHDLCLNRNAISIAGNMALYFYGIDYSPKRTPFEEQPITLYFDIGQIRSGNTELFTEGGMWAGLNLEEDKKSYLTAMRIDSTRKFTMVGDPLPSEENPHEVFNMAVMPIERLLVANNVSSYGKQCLRQVQRMQTQAERILSVKELSFMRIWASLDKFIEYADDPTVYRANKVRLEYCEEVLKQHPEFKRLTELEIFKPHL